MIVLRLKLHQLLLESLIFFLEQGMLGQIVSLRARLGEAGFFSAYIPAKQPCPQILHFFLQFLDHNLHFLWRFLNVKICPVFNCFNSLGEFQRLDALFSVDVLPTHCTDETGFRVATQTFFEQVSQL